MVKQLSALLCMVLLASCMNYSAVELVDVQDAQVRKLDASGIAVSVTVQVHNPNNYNISVMDPDMDLYVNNVAMGKATLDTLVTLDPASTRAYALPLHATFTNGPANMLPLLMTAALTGSFKVGLKGTAVGKARTASALVS